MRFITEISSPPSAAPTALPPSEPTSPNPHSSTAEPYEIESQPRPRRLASLKTTEDSMSELAARTRRRRMNVSGLGIEEGGPRSPKMLWAEGKVAHELYCPVANFPRVEQKASILRQVCPAPSSPSRARLHAPPSLRPHYSPHRHRNSTNQVLVTTRLLRRLLLGHPRSPSRRTRPITPSIQPSRQTSRPTATTSFTPSPFQRLDYHRQHPSQCLSQRLPHRHHPRCDRFTHLPPLPLRRRD